MSYYPDQIHFQSQLEGASPTRWGEGPGRPSFQCPDCPDQKPYAQKQGLERHRGEKHELNFECSHPCGCRFKWPGSRKYMYKNHLRKTHGLNDNEIEEILAKPSRRCRGGDSIVESGQVDRHSEPEATTTKHDDSNGLEHLAATHAPRLFSKEDIAKLGRYHRFHGGFRLPAVHPSGPTAADIPFNTGMLHLSAHPYPVSGDHMAELPRSMTHSHLHISDYWETETNSFAALGGLPRWH